MESVFTPLDLTLFIAFLVLAMVVGLIAGRREETSEDYYLAGRSIRWWGVAGSIFGSNVSANHLVGMMGIGFSVGFAQSHFELGAIAGLMLLCYGFLPVYRKLNVYTLSQYLEMRYDQRSRLAYALIMLAIMTGIHMGQGLYIGARSTCVLLGGDAVTQAEDESTVTSSAEEAPGDEETESTPAAKQRILVNRSYYTLFVILFAAVSATYTIFGGLKAVVWTDVIQSVLMLIAALIVAALVFYSLDGWSGWSTMMRLDSESGEPKMRLYLPSNHPDLPWTGVFTGLMAMHFFYWGTNQFIVQRALGARSDSEARLGIIVAGFLKLLIPIMSIAAGIAAYYLFIREKPDTQIAPDTAFTEVVKLVVPLGFGIVGLIAAGLIGAILSSIDSMMNSAATIFSIDIYRRYLRPDASDPEMILVGRMFIVAMVALATAIALFVINPNSQDNFFLQIANYQNYLTPGVLVVFALGMFWKRGTRTAAFVTILAGILFSFLVQYSYDNWIGDPELASHRRVYQASIGQIETDALVPSDFPESLRDASDEERVALVEEKRETMSWAMKTFGPKLAFFHRVVAVIVLCVLLFVGLSMFEKPNKDQQEFTWVKLGSHPAGQLKLIVAALLVSLAVFGALALLVGIADFSKTMAGIIGGLWTAGMFLAAVVISPVRRGDSQQPIPFLHEDRLWAGILCGLAIWMLFYFA